MHDSGYTHLATAGPVIGGAGAEPTEADPESVVSKGEARGWKDDLLSWLDSYINTGSIEDASKEWDEAELKVAVG
ncbi:hypothetical protein N7491_004629 [Penicillium cf. griseofulvum]|uniref:Uncharacterized protein n=1 Tax=Penicillium cf. griseofulvum TaxID=2972120 RepID=A0A9W9M3Y3_9EURO|nr:hypothetical protein N7472_007319 [Penicillium cf. griseofulvum]KAJ5434034.1 hypothetical protein N7491_004629 [Penicillium cf. griseofulvum]KAJ5451866.1 hypothetical protein N7445_000049 [Penicillium cf. griseofulvum]